MPRYGYAVTASGMQTRQGQQRNVIYVYLADDAAAEAFRPKLQAILNAKITSVSKQIFSDPDGPYPSAVANGGSELARLLFRSGPNTTENLQIPFVKSTIQKEDLEDLFEDATNGLQNRSGGALGEVVDVRFRQMADG